MFIVKARIKNIGTVLIVHSYFNDKSRKKLGLVLNPECSIALWLGPSSYSFLYNDAIKIIIGTYEEES